ncbi:MAG TPA: hypothetical protein VHX40_03935, partial [Acidimicrobiales bacterium]|nr:hypothetical protein [Acidimicrobiales bacterium]
MDEGLEQGLAVGCRPGGEGNLDGIPNCRQLFWTRHLGRCLLHRCLQLGPSATQVGDLGGQLLHAGAALVLRQGAGLEGAQVPLDTLAPLQIILRQYLWF